MTYPSMPYIKYATENYINPKYNLAKSDVAPPNFKEVVDNDTFYSSIQKDAYSLLKEVRSLLSINYGIKEEELEFTIGVTNSFSSIAQLIRSLGGKRVISESPGYEPFWLTPKGHGLDVAFLDRCPVDFSINLDRLSSLVKRGDWLWISNPHNPSGRYIDPHEIKEIATILKSKGAFLFVDEIYLDFLSPLGSKSCALIDENVFVASSLTKVYGLGGLKVGWVIGNQELIKQMTINRLHQFMLPPGPSLAMILSIWDKLEKIREKNTADVCRRVELLKDELKGSINFLNPFLPINFMPLGNEQDDIRFAKSLLQETGLIVAPGTFFNSPGSVRISAAGNEKDVTEGSKILKKYL